MKDYNELILFLIRVATFPYRFWIAGPDPITGRCCREQGSEWVLSYEPSEPHMGHSGCVYASTAMDVIRKAKRLLATQERAAKMVEAARR